MIKIATVCTGIGSPEKAIENLGISHEIVFGCEIDKYARQTYLSNFNPGFMVPDMTKESWEGEQFYSDLFIGGIPCQAFSLAGKRLGELDPRGLLFFDFYRYVKNQKPKYFIIENVKGLLSDNAGATFQNWINLLGQSVNGDPFMFPHEDSLMYNLHWQVLNTKDYGLPQNRERVFLIGIRNDLPNSFVFPKGVPLKLRLKDILEPEVDEKYYLSEKMLTMLTMHSERHKEKGTGFSVEYKGENDIANCLRANAALCPTDNILKIIGNSGTGGQRGDILDITGISSCLAATDYKQPKQIKVPSATKSGYEIATEGNQRIAGWFENENVIGAYRDDAKRSSVSEHIYQKEDSICNTIQCAHVPKVIQGGEWRVASGETTSCNQGVVEKSGLGVFGNNKKDQHVKNIENALCLKASNTVNPRSGGTTLIQETSNCLTSVQKDNLVVTEIIQLNNPKHSNDRIYSDEGLSPTLNTMQGGNRQPFIENNYRIRKLTVLECFRLQGFADEFLQNAIDAGVSNSQLYKQAGNSISVPVIQAILKNLLKK